MNEISQEAAITNAAPVESQAPKTFSQEQVNSLVGKVRQETREKARQETLSEIAAQQNAQQQGNVSQSQPMASYDPHADARRIAQEEFAKHQQALKMQADKAAADQWAAKTINEVTAKVNDAKTRYPDFDNVVNLKHFQQMPEVLHYVNTVDNAGDVMYDLFKNPSKIGGLRMLPPELATQEVMKLSNSIKQNQLANANPQTPEPLSQIKPSTIGLGNGSEKNASVSSLRNDPRYRG